MSNFILPDPAYEKSILTGTLIERDLLTKADRRTFLLKLELNQPTHYTSGDSFALYPENSHTAVINFIQTLNLDPDLKVDAHLSVYDFLKKKVSLSKWTSKMSALLFKEGKLPDELKELQPITILKQLTISTTLGLQLLPLLPPQMPRYYSIASSPCHSPGHLDLLVCLNCFECEGVTQFGLASSYLCLDAPLGTQLYGFIHHAEHFRLPCPSEPIIMIGPGTGVAPFRAFIQDRIAQGASQNWLFFGERTRQNDFYFEDEFLTYQDQNRLKLSLAFSRDQEHKVYVQHLLMEHKQQIYEWMSSNAHIYVCGDAKNMARDVESSLVSIIAEYESLDYPSALMKLRSWRKEKRYHLDVY
jgi:sulfite reductase (NADPH) flavoprotein alpha-component